VGFDSISNVIYSTNDSGNSWISYAIVSNVTLGKIYFEDQFNGWAIGAMGAIFYTNNSGITWQNQTSFIGTNLTIFIS